MVNFFTKLYSALYNRDVLPKLFFSILRVAVRYIANVVLPFYLSYGKYKERKDSEIIVSFTSFPGRINKVWMVVECLKRQTLKPHKIILWLSKEQFPYYKTIPESLRRREDNLFSIEIVEGDIRSHKKYYYTLKSKCGNLVTLVDDDIIYPLDMLEKLYSEHLRHPSSIICRYGYIRTYNNKLELQKYINWKEVLGYTDDPNFFFGSGGGTLIPTAALYKDVVEKDIFLKLVPFADDVWLNAMANLNNTRVIKLATGLFMPIINKSEKLSTSNLLDNKNDVQINSVINYYTNKLGKNPFNYKNAN